MGTEMAKSHTADTAVPSRKLSHIKCCLKKDVQYNSMTTGLEGLDLTYEALPDRNLDSVDQSTLLLGRRLAAPC